ncbi:2Fe-2S iron-sulfur cluster-binding protein [Hoeflea poritis]|uniref:2Fe-2S iron-sulfur cluster-binding protein n=1 Tax=Hoeflea poritis TaxID=2993659 RepID=A0ABT4VL47_9HYPH|nr:2Fe-2S iron-sulfur cluster-binding protein [Hoeflea poritis]MDA4845421.1 2Fe-2S iron-sulfur cluster-binding protein [Hoeflea poritis]
MVKITFIQPDGSSREIEAEPGTSVMETALANNVDGITAECNGSAACATCHAYFEEDRLNSLDAMAEHENDMLDFAACERRSGSRLSCQIKVTEALDGITVTLPEMQ